MFQTKPKKFARTINWFETIVKALLTLLVQETGRYLLARLRSRKEKLSPFVRKWGLSGLGTVFIGWVVLSFLGWIAFSANAAFHQGVASAPTIIVATFALGFMVGLPGIILNRVTMKLDSKHWVARMTNSYSTTKSVQEKDSERGSNDSKNRIPYIQFLHRAVHIE
jgi:hypothetical protein